MTFYIGTYQEWNYRVMGDIAHLAQRLGADGFFSIGPSAFTKPGIVVHTFRDVPHAMATLCGGQLEWVALELGGTPLTEFTHPENAAYLLGPNTGTLSRDQLTRMDHKVTVEGDTLPTPAVAAITLHSRITARVGAL